MSIIISDIDGTLANHTYRKHLIEGEHRDYDTFHAMHVEDKPKKNVIRKVKATAKSNILIVVTGRYSIHRHTTLKQLKSWGINPKSLYMREEDDRARNHEIKLRWLNEIRNKYNMEVEYMFDDNIQVINAFVENKITCFHVTQNADTYSLVKP